MTKTKKVVHLHDVRQKKRRNWTLAEIEKRAAEEYAVYRKVAKDEPADLVSGGDMKRILEEPNDEEQR